MESDASSGFSSTTSWEIPTVAADPSFVDGVASKDVVLDEESNIWVRLYLPAPAAAPPPPPPGDEHSKSNKLPVLLHVHGGGFVTFSAATVSYHHFCKKIAREANVIVISLNHRLAPQFRLPAPYEDLVSTLEWLQSQASAAAAASEAESGAAAAAAAAAGGGGDQVSKEAWLVQNADFSRVIFMGGSSGGNIVHNMLLRLQVAQFPALKFQSQILLQPFFGGQSRTNSELLLCNGPILTLDKSDQLWSLALPEDASSQDHPFCNPAMVPLATLKQACLPKCLLLVGGQDLLHDRQVEFASQLKNAGVHVHLVEFPEAAHGFVTSSGTISYVFMPEVLNFIRDSK